MGSSRQQAVALMALAVLAVAFLAGAGVASAARPAPGSGGEEAVSSAAEYLGMSYSYPAAAAVEKAREAVVEQAREAVETLLLARLPAGPSPRGPGH